MNQLQSLLHDSLIATGHIQHCAIIRRKDTSLRASTVGFSPSLDNIHALVHCFTNSSLARREGLKFQDTVYECVRADRFSVYAKKENMGIILVRTATLLLVATYTPEMSPSICVEAVEKLADYFREKGKWMLQLWCAVIQFGSLKLNEIKNKCRKLLLCMSISDCELIIFIIIYTVIWNTLLVAYLSVV